MSLQGGSSPTTAPRPVLVSQPWLTAARIAWVVMALTAAAIWFLGMPLYHQEALTFTNVDGFVNRSPAIWRIGLHQLGLSPYYYADTRVATEALIAWPMFLIGVLVFLRKSGEWIGLFASLAFVIFGTDGTNAASVALANAYPGWAPLFNLFDNVGWISFFLLPYIFPDGRVVPRWTLWPALAAITTEVGSAFFPGSVFDSLQPAVLLVVFGSALAAGIYRYRQVSDRIQQQQTKWAVFGLSLAITITILAVIAGFGIPWFTAAPQRAVAFDMISLAVLALAFLAVPICFAIAIFRYKLWDVDVLVNRTLVYLSLTISLAAVYLGGVIGLQALFRTITGQSSDLAVAISTLLIAALFQPWRRRLQAFIDRRFYRRKYDAARTLATFQAKLRDEVDLDRLTTEILAVVQNTVEPRQVSLWLQDKNLHS